VSLSTLACGHARLDGIGKFEERFDTADDFVLFFEGRERKNPFSHGTNVEMPEAVLGGSSRQSVHERPESIWCGFGLLSAIILSDERSG
jgi:hypothetical protein